MASSYEQRAVGFLDILGFEEKVLRSEKEPDYLSEIVEALVNVQIKINEDQGNSRKTVVNMVNFSDSIILFSALTADGFWRVLTYMNLLADELLMRGALSRGGVECGALFHHDRVVFGPAFIRAYQLENNIAQHPRIVLGASAFDAAQRFASENEQGFARQMLQTYIRRDTDGVPYLDHFSFYDSKFEGSDVDNLDLMVNKCEIVRELILKELALSLSKPAVFAKYAWFAERYNQMVGRNKANDQRLTHIDIYGPKDGHIPIKGPFDI